MRIAIAGASGRMGRMLTQAVVQSPDLILAAALTRAGSDSCGQDATATTGEPSGVRITDQLDDLGGVDCLIDFSRPEATLQHLDACVRHRVNIVIGTTGFDDAGRAAIARAAEQIGVVFSANMSVGVNATFKLLDMAARLLNDGFDVEVLEAHHRRKVDAPSGTALAMGEVVADAWGRPLNEVAEWARHGDTGARKPGTIGFSVVRGGDIVGEHTVFFCGDGERVEITHRASNRSTFVDGSLRAARFLATRGPGLYDMQDVLAPRD